MILILPLEAERKLPLLSEQAYDEIKREMATLANPNPHWKAYDEIKREMDTHAEECCYF